MKENIIRVRKTETIYNIENALLSLLEIKPINEITVKEVCKIAEVNHSTFYLYYYDNFDLYSDIKKKAFDEMENALISAFSRLDAEEQLNELTNKIKNTFYFRRLLKQSSSGQFKEELIRVIHPKLEKKVFPMWKEKERNYVVGFILQGSLSILEEWIKKDYAEDEEYIAYILYKLCSSIDIYHH